MAAKKWIQEDYLPANCFLPGQEAVEQGASHKSATMKQEYSLVRGVPVALLLSCSRAC